MIKAYWSELCWVYTVGFIHPYLKTANKPKPWQMGFIVALGKTSSQTDVLKGLRQVGTSFLCRVVASFQMQHNPMSSQA